MRDVRTPAVTTQVPARPGRLSWIKADPWHYCAMPFPAPGGTPRPREGS